MTDNPHMADSAGIGLMVMRIAAPEAQNTISDLYMEVLRRVEAALLPQVNA